MNSRRLETIHPESMEPVSKLPVAARSFGIRSLFNLVEVTMCIGVIAVGISGVMSLFPMGFNASRNAIGETYSTFAAHEFISYIARNCNNPAKSYGSGARDFWEEYIYPAPASGIPETIPSEADENDATFSAVPNSPIYASDNPGLYRIEQGSSGIIDFRATVRVWRSKIENLYIYNQNVPEISYQYAVQLRVEVSWPVEKPYAQREKRYYVKEIFRQEF
ncbi:MAG: hypothetical protein JW808_07060 [Victivallales bacterium]|nr:hypothetical protein [Victivallales bacterium]